MLQEYPKYKNEFNQGQQCCCKMALAMQATGYCQLVNVTTGVHVVGGGWIATNRNKINFKRRTAIKCHDTFLPKTVSQRINQKILKYMKYSYLI